MQPLYAYLLKLSFCLALGYLFYYVLLRRMTYYQWNRHFLLLFPLFALVVPVLPFYPAEKLSSFNAVFFITDSTVKDVSNSLTPHVQKGIQWNFLSMAIWLVMAGSLFFLLRFITRFYSLQRTRKAARLLDDGDIKLYQLPGTKAPFSFHNSIYLDTSLYTGQDLQNIIAHEMVHVTQKHTTDMILSELLCIIQWFNPFAWLLKQAIRQNLEFIADDMVLQNGVNRKGYQYLLLKVSGAIPHTLANNLLFPSLKKRIQMMNRTRTTKVHLLKFICIVPLACLLLLAFSGPAAKPSGPVMVSAEAFSLGSLSFYINDAAVAEIVKKEQGKSFLKAGGPLSLSLISEEKARLAALLVKNGYDQLNEHSITFVMDTSAVTKSFSVQVTIQLEQQKKTMAPVKNSMGISQADPANSETYPRYTKQDPDIK